jgi:hypothetical protein
MRILAGQTLAFAISVSNVVFAGDDLRALAPRLAIPELEWVRAMNPKLCKALLLDLKQWRNVVEIKPFIVGASPQSPEIRANLGNCDSDKLLSFVQIEDRVWRGNNLDAFTPEEREHYGTRYQLTGEVRLFRANIDNDPTGSEELVLYASQIARGGEIVKYASQFHVIDIKTCRVTNSAQGSDSPRNTDFFVGLLRHGARTYIFNASVYPNEFDFGRTQQASVTLQRWMYNKTTDVRFFGPACYYQTKEE